MPETEEEYIIVATDSGNPETPSGFLLRIGNSGSISLDKIRRFDRVATANLAVASWSGGHEAIVAFLRTDGIALR